MTTHICPACGELRDVSESGKTIDTEGVCEYCLLAVEQNAPLLTSHGMIFIEDILVNLKHKPSNNEKVEHELEDEIEHIMSTNYANGLMYKNIGFFVIVAKITEENTVTLVRTNINNIALRRLLLEWIDKNKK